MEVTVAVLVLLAFGLFESHHRASRAAADSNAFTKWAEQAAPAITTLINDSRAIQTDSAPLTTVPAPQFQADALQYRQELTRVQQLKSPPDPDLALRWRAILQEASAASLDLAGTQTSDAADLAQTHVRFVALDGVLVALEQAIHPA